VCVRAVCDNTPCRRTRCCISRPCACATLRRVTLHAYVRACVHATASMGATDRRVGGVGSIGWRERRRGRCAIRETVTAANHSYPSPPWRANHTAPHPRPLNTASPGQAGTPSSSTCPIHLPKGPFSWCPRPRACVYVYARCTRRRTVTGMTRLLLYYCYYNIIIVYSTMTMICRRRSARAYTAFAAVSSQIGGGLYWKCLDPVRSIPADRNIKYITK